MKLLSLYLRGAIGIQKGLGLDEINIDLSKFKPGLIALTGKNGAGKTTIMENLHPFRTMVSRSGSLQSHFYLKDSFRILKFEHSGDVYESKILIDALTMSSQAFLLKNDLPINDGKLSTYDESIEAVLGSEELFFNSVFSGQKSKGISELKTAERRKLFYELLSLDKYEIYHTEIKGLLKSEELKLATCEGEITANEFDGAERTLAQENLQDKTKLLAELMESNKQGKANRIIFFDESTALSLEIAKLETKLENNILIEKRIKVLKEKIEAETLETDVKKLDFSVGLVNLNSQKSDLEELLTERKEIDNKRDELKSLITIKEAEELELKALDKRELEFNKKHIENLTALDKIKDSVEESERAYKVADENIIKIAGLIDVANMNIDIVSGVPCKTKSIFGGFPECQFLLNSENEKKELPLLNREIEIAKNIREKTYNIFTSSKVDYDNEKTDTENEKIETLKSIEVIRKSTQEKIDGLNILIEPLQLLGLEEKKEKLNNAEADIKLIDAGITAQEKMISEFEVTAGNRMSELKTQIASEQKALDLTIQKVIDEKNQESRKFDNILDTTFEAIKHQDEQIDHIKNSVDLLNIELKVFVEKKEKLVLLREKKTIIQTEIQEFSFLAKAFDKTGIPVLKLENSGVEITTIANELLALFENKFRIVFETTKLKADKKEYKESFDINVIEESGICEISNKSGGQQVLIETAIRLAISLVVRKQGRNIETSFLDESDGALDLDNAINYKGMIEKAHTLSGIFNTFVITHRPELLSLIPQQIELSNGILKIKN